MFFFQIPRCRRRSCDSPPEQVTSDVRGMAKRKDTFSDEISGSSAKRC